MNALSEYESTLERACRLHAEGRLEDAVGAWQRVLERRPRMADAHFNLALLYRKLGRFSDAIAAYEAAVRLGIDRVEEVYSNLGVLYAELRNAEEASRMYRHALSIAPDYVPALFNLAGLLEETGATDEAIATYRRILALDPGHWESLARIANAARVMPGDEDTVAALHRAIGRAGDDRQAREGLYFALGKALDDQQRYDEAFVAYRAANELGRQRNPPYRRTDAERAFDVLMQVFDADWLRRSELEPAESPIFICGMFRSGSTLLEQILAGHPSITAGGELDSLPRLVARLLAPYPQRAATASRDELAELRRAYLARLHELFPRHDIVTDKRLQNFLYLGVVRALFPRARIVHTKRNPPDNCLSIYFQQLGANLGYATDLEDIAHYYRQHERLMSHWREQFGGSIFTVDYDELVRAPEPVVRSLLDFIGLQWDDGCLALQGRDNLVQTASVSQVRESLHTSSSGRWRNYESYLDGMMAQLE